MSATILAPLVGHICSCTQSRKRRTWNQSELRSCVHTERVVSIDAQNGYHEFTCSVQTVTLGITLENGTQIHSQASTLSLGGNKPLQFAVTRLDLIRLDLTTSLQVVFFEEIKVTGRDMIKPQISGADPGFGQGGLASEAESCQRSEESSSRYNPGGRRTTL